MQRNPSLVSTFVSGNNNGVHSNRNKCQIKLEIAKDRIRNKCTDEDMNGFMTAWRKVSTICFMSKLQLTSVVKKYNDDDNSLENNYKQTKM